MSAQSVLDYLQQQSLLLSTAESCTAGAIMALLAKLPGSGSRIECGYVVYSPEAKQRLLNVSSETIERFNLTSVEVATEMAVGALRDSPATAAIATTGVCGPDSMDGIPAGTVCFAWGFIVEEREHVFSQRRQFSGDRETVQNDAAIYALEQLPLLHKSLIDARHPDAVS
jgi:PncC family amidohydrolase